MFNIKMVKTEAASTSTLSTRGVKEKPAVSFSSLTSDYFSVKPQPVPRQQTSQPQPVPRQQTPQPQPVLRQQVPQPQPIPVPKQKRAPLPPANVLLKKGQKYSITKNFPSVSRYRIGMGWESGYDIDIEAFMLQENGLVPDDSWIVFYGQHQSPDGAVVHKGDSSTGASFGADCEQIDVDTARVNKNISKIVFVVTINEAKKYGYNFSGIKNAYIRFSDIATGKELFRYELTDYYKEVVSMVTGELYLRNGEWRFNPVGMGTGDDLEGLCNKYGIEVK